MACTPVILERLLAKCEPGANGCVLFVGGYRDRDGYGFIAVDRRMTRVHRVTYEALVGPIPEGLVIDHLCRNRNCVTPGHLRAVEQRVNIHADGSRCTTALNAQKTHCPQGHRYDEANTRITRRNGTVMRACRRCDRDRQRDRRRAA